MKPTAIAATLLVLSAQAACAAQPVVVLDGERAPDKVANTLEITCGKKAYRLVAVNSYTATPAFAITEDGGVTAGASEIAKVTQEAKGFLSAGFTNVRCLPSDGGFVARVHVRMRPDKSPGAKSFNISWFADRTVWIGAIEDHP